MIEEEKDDIDVIIELIGDKVVERVFADERFVKLMTPEKVEDEEIKEDVVEETKDEVFEEKQEEPKKRDIYKELANRLRGVR